MVIIIDALITVAMRGDKRRTNSHLTIVHDSLMLVYDHSNPFDQK